MKLTLIFLLGCCLAETTFGWTYHYINKTMNWTKAREWCQTTYTDMVVIQNQDENNYLVSKLPNRTGSPYYWIGITKQHKNETWTWIGNNSTWIGKESWAANEPNNNHSTEFCVEIYVSHNANRGKWNDEKCANKKSPVCYKAQCEETSCENGRCQESIENTTCLCEPGFEGDRCQTAVQCPPLSHPDNVYLSCSGGNLTINSTCQFKCHLDFLMIGPTTVTCGATGIWKGPRPTCSRYEQALMAVAGCGALSTFCCICLCWMKRRKRKKLAQESLKKHLVHPVRHWDEGQLEFMFYCNIFIMTSVLNKYPF
ncbi:L-selectin-like [Notolabrus celidotus]|uniref:L-selectin-like n=1 Tax=Notolabrus celidotus TaxID=1203425 RepID=UPI00149056DE|nr:L-selectin-like [Notolabrus celidotus]